MRGKEKEQFVITIVFTLVALILMVVYNFTSFYSKSTSDMEAIGSSSLMSESEQLEKYFARGIDTLRATKYTVNYMLENGASSREIEDYFRAASKNYQEDIDENFTGLYGLVQDVYIDGVGWVPDEDYNPTTRDWYVQALEASGEPMLVAPYLDSQTGQIIASVSCLLDDGKSVISLDIVLDKVQEITQAINLNGMGYGFVVDNSGMVVGHYDENERGKNYRDDPEMSQLLQNMAEGNTSFRMKLSEEACTVFMNTVQENWRVVMVVSNTKLFEEIREILMKNILVCLAVFILIVLFCSLAFRRVDQSIKLEYETSQKLEHLYENIVRALAHTIDAKDRYTRGHSQRVARYSLEIAKRMKKTKRELQDIYYAGLLHDVGKIRVSEDVINKSGRLTEEEFEQIKVHPVTGFHILKDIYEDRNIANGARYHHERYDGRGYPNGLIGEDIPEIARIIGVADAYDAMASNRSYRKVLPQEVVKAEIEKGRGRQFDPEVTDIMLQMIEEDKDYQMKQMDGSQKNILVVDDLCENIQKVASIMQDELAWHIIGATSGMDALNQLKEKTVDLILLDIQMPDMDGFEVLPLIREKSQAPIVFMTDTRKIETIRKAVELGVGEYITKPFLPLALKEIIHGMIDEETEDSQDLWC